VPGALCSCKKKKNHPRGKEVREKVDQGGGEWATPAACINGWPSTRKKHSEGAGRMHSEKPRTKENIRTPCFGRNERWVLPKPLFTEVTTLACDSGPPVCGKEHFFLNRIGSSAFAKNSLCSSTDEGTSGGSLSYGGYKRPSTHSGNRTYLSKPSNPGNW